MVKRNMHDSITAVQSLASAARTATANGTAADLKGYDSCEAVVDLGAWTDGTHTPSIQESDDNSTFAAVAAADLDGSFTAMSGTASDNNVQIVGYVGSKRYVRVVMTISSATTGALSAAAIIRGDRKDAGATLTD
jgi:hypothetical protein